MGLNTNKLKKTGKGTPPLPSTSKENLSKAASGQKVPLQVKISAELRREVRAYAAEHEVELSNLFKSMWLHYRESHG